MKTSPAPALRRLRLHLRERQGLSVLFHPLLLVLMPVAAGFYALYAGQDVSWDLRNYHFYNPFAFLTGRMGYDIAVAHVATYYNPLMHLPFYWAVTAWPPKIVGFLLGGVAGFNAWLIYGIARQTIDLGSRRRTAWACLALAGISLLGAMNLAEIGTSYGDNILSLPILAAIWLILRFRARFIVSLRSGWPVAAAAGLLAGATLGLKLPFAVYAVALCAAFFGLNLPFRRRFGLAVIFGLGVLGGAALTGGFWMLEMGRRFQNPLFPYFNQFFQSPWGAIGSYRDERFLPSGLWHSLRFPIELTFNPLQVGEVAFRDLRLPLVYILLLTLLGRTLWRFRAGRNVVHTPEAQSRVPDLTRFLILFLVVAFVLWMKLFAVYRYAIVCEFLAPLMILLLLVALVRDTRRQFMMTGLCLVVAGISVVPGNWGRRPWTTDYFDVQVPPLAEPSKTLILTAGHDATAYLIPFFPPATQFLRIQGYLTGPSPTPNATDRLMRQIVDAHAGPLYMLYRSYEEYNALNALDFYGLDLDRTDCRRFAPGIEPQPEHPYYLCRVKRQRLNPHNQN